MDFNPTGIAATAAGILDGMEGPLGLVWDIGAHIGGFSKRALEMGAEHVVAVEPSAENMAKLKESCGEDRMTYKDAALWPIKTPVALRKVGENSGQYACDGSIGSGPAVSTCTIVDLYVVKGRWPDTMKVDVEGAEWELLFDENFQEAMRQATNLHMEFHGKWPGALRPRVEEALVVLDELGLVAPDPLIDNKGSGWLKGGPV